MYIHIMHTYALELRAELRQPRPDRRGLGPAIHRIGSDRSAIHPRRNVSAVNQCPPPEGDRFLINNIK